MAALFCSLILQIHGPAWATQPVREARQAAVDALQTASQRKWSIRWDSQSNLPRTLAGGMMAGVADGPIDAALQFVREHGSLFGLTDARAPLPVNVEYLRDKQLPGGQLVTLQQTAGLLPIVDARVGVVVSSDGVVRHVSSSAVQLPAGTTLKFSLSPSDAAHRAVAAIDSQRPYRLDKQPQLALLADSEPRVVYDMVLSFDRGYWEPWQVLVDASDGTIARQRRLIMEATGTGRVFIPNPVVSLGDLSLRDNSDAASAVPSAAYRVVPLENLNDPVRGKYALSGSYVTMVNKSIPTNTPPLSANGDFLYWRDNDAFEEVMAYYTIDRSQTYIQSLGYFDINNRAIEVDAHAVFGWDNSFYTGSPIGAGYIEFGDGGVDDAEDADIILHEYGHAIQDNSNPGVFFGNADNGFGNETGAMAEGFCDYWAASSTYDTCIARVFPPEFFGEWNALGLASGPQYYLRLVNTAKFYPWDMVDEVHTDGEIWSGLLWELLETVGRDATDRIVLYSHFLLPPNPDFADGAQALMDADALLFPALSDLNGPIAGEHYNAICGIASARGILSCSLVCDCSEHGNARDDDHMDLLDVIAISEEAFLDGAPAPVDPLCPHLNRADFNCDRFIDATDVSMAVDYVFMNGSGPCDPCE